MANENVLCPMVKNFFSFLTSEFNFHIINEKIRGNVFYEIQFRNKDKIISISYENIEDYLQVIVFILKNGEMPDYDDKTKTLHLKYLNKALLSKIDKDEILVNNEHFNGLAVDSDWERKLLKSAKELRLCLKHFDTLE